MTTSVSFGLPSGSRELYFPLAAAVLGAAAIASPTSALIAANGIGLSLSGAGYQGFIGSWAGSSAVAVSERYILTAAHTGGGVGSAFTMNGQTHTAIATIQGPGDLMLVEVDSDLAGWHDVTTEVAVGDEIVMGGLGQITAGDTAEGLWSGVKEERWGTNTISDLVTDDGGLIELTYDNTGDPASTEAHFTGNDSGGGVFTVGADGSLSLVGIAVGVDSQVDGAATFGDTSYAIDLTSGAARAFLSQYNIPAPGTAVFAASALALASRRRRG